jgi:hypothetical protein
MCSTPPFQNLHPFFWEVVFSLLPLINSSCGWNICMQLSLFTWILESHGVPFRRSFLEGEEVDKFEGPLTVAYGHPNTPDNLVQ